MQASLPAKTSLWQRNSIRRSVILTVVVVPFLALIYAIRTLWMRAVHPVDLIMLAVMYVLVVLGIGMGLHRMLTHRSFQANPVIKFILLVLGSMSLEGPVIGWAATHTKHHALADREGDPHSPLEGFAHAHVGWLFRDTKSDADPAIYCKHLLNDRLVVFVNNTFFLWVALSLAIPFAIDGWTGLLWAGLVRIFLVHHVTWSVNSICHTFGRREYQTKDESRNEWIIGMLALGEGWHNNHHAFPRSAFHGLRWWQFDVSGYLIRLLERLKLVRDVYRVTPTMLARNSARNAKLAPALEEDIVA